MEPQSVWKSSECGAFGSTAMTSFSFRLNLFGNPDCPTALFDQSTFESRALSRNSVLTAQMAEGFGNGGYAHLLELYNTIRDEWFALPAEFRDECKKYIDGQALEGSPASAEAPAKEKKAKKKG